jgi:prophage regulatory protein
MNAAPMFQIRPLYLPRAAAAAYLALSENTLDRLVARGNAPKPRQLSQGRVAWLVDDLDAWGRARPVSDILPPENSGFGRAGKPT